MEIAVSVGGIMSESLKSIITKHRVLVLLGAGGVGKTTSSVALAFSAAQLGLRVGLLSIDPARRLASALGICMGKNLESVDLKDLGYEGTISAAMIDQKEVFDGMVCKHAPDQKIRDRILNNGLYKACSEYLGGAVEYMALAQLQDMVESQRFDLVILDTPPAQHVVDFLSKPNILSDFFESNVTKILLKPFVMASRLGLGRMVSLGERLMGGLAKIAGVKSLELLAEFMLQLQEVLAGFNQAGENILQTLQKSSTAFICVTAPRVDACKASREIIDSVRAQKYQIKGFLWNRDWPESVKHELRLEKLENYADQRLVSDIDALKKRLAQQEDLFSEMRDYSLQREVAMFRVPEWGDDIHSLVKMDEIGRYLKELNAEQSL